MNFEPSTMEFYKVYRIWRMQYLPDIWINWFFKISPCFTFAGWKKVTKKKTRPIKYFELRVYFFTLFFLTSPKENFNDVCYLHTQAPCQASFRIRSTPYKRFCSCCWLRSLLVMRDPKSAICKIVLTFEAVE